MDDAEAAEYLKVEPRTLRVWRKSRGLPHLKLTSKCIRYRRPDLDQWEARHMVEMVA